MLRRTHTAVGLCSTAIFIKEPRDIILIGVFTAVGSLLPDIDAPAASLIRRFKYITLAIATALLYVYFTDNIIPLIFLTILTIYGASTEHRTFMHSLIGLISFSACIYAIEPRLGIYFIIGYSLHLFCDSLTPRGVPLLYPFLKRKYTFNKLYTGSSSDKIIGYMCILFYLSFFTLK